MKKHHFSHVAINSARLLFGTMRDHGGLSRAELAQHTGLSRPTVSDAMQRLESWALVRATERRTKGQGRSGVIYELNDSYGAIVALSVDHQHACIQVQNLSQQILYSHELDINTIDAPDPLTRLLIEQIDQALDSLQLPVKSIGIALAAPVSPQSQQAVPLPTLPFSLATQINWVAVFQYHYAVPVSIDNDVNWAARSEVIHGVAQHINNFIYVYLGRGIGAGIYLDGKIVQGSNGLAGELGYVAVEGNMTLQDYVTNALENGQIAFDDMVINIARVIATSAIIFNPDAIILGGPLTGQHQLQTGLIHEIPTHLLRSIPVLPSSMPIYGPLAGAADGAYDALLADTGLYQHNEEKNALPKQQSKETQP